MKKFETPKMEIIAWDVEDVITSSAESTIPDTGDNGTGFEPMPPSITD